MRASSREVKHGSVVDVSLTSSGTALVVAVTGGVMERLRFI